MKRNYPLKHNPNWHIAHALCGLENGEELGEHFRIQKYIDGTLVTYNRYKSYEEATKELSFIKFLEAAE